jgi:tetratricopeptide (TPR) repeat protein
VTDDIRSLTARLAEEPSSLAFLELGEALRRRGQLEPAYKVARGGLAKYPGLADAHDLMARILSDQGDLAGAFDAWADALRFDPMRVGALKGIAFLYYRAGDVTAATDHLQRAAEADPDDETIPLAIQRLRSESRRGTVVPPPPVQQPEPMVEEKPAATRHPDSPFGDLDQEESGLLLLDTNGLRLGGTINGVNGGDAGDRVAAQLAGVSREAGRATRLLALGSWHSIAIETPDGHCFLSAPTSESVLLAARSSAVPMARLALVAERAARAARGWLERMQ